MVAEVASVKDAERPSRPVMPFASRSDGALARHLPPHQNRIMCADGQPPSEWSALKYGFEPTE
ncbi:hypothetical protein, partial [Methylobacterium frigidaeris]|uniref:hypothetical protein n=1 Tax=Methylobacterium frigidaeris TaxID=2038277 RepID=UPI001EDD2016